MKEEEQDNALATTTARWFKSLLDLSEKVAIERKKYESLMIEKRTLPEFQQLNSICAQLAGYASSAKYILKDNDIDITPYP